jgi:Flp pilus assembly pilin Flp
VGFDRREADPVQQLASQLRRDDQRGQTMAEYAIVVSIIAIGVVASLSALSVSVMAGIQRAADIVASVV